MTPVTAPNEGRTAPVLFSHPTTEERAVTRNPGSVEVPRFESSSDTHAPAPRHPDHYPAP
ncbi:hypothetical protein LV79_006510 [Actinokineospora globicatena]|uniref:Uncharacterized protein n=1 Tax=Actinokineospora globicatena TaxID=103729 RepID=A0A9W6QRP8_9PSEU|nr:hypothetical protein [Actinokineospora globicatena]GLW82102.1 hypothetical protein Aglo01_65830 [Actinokineospora globicatena]GLW88895.1 hypothetical protein Aglo02_65340 [Actinokineospora globicatena]GLW94901.1 hypothetical protein Aglo03_57170 [Actinokineospora globicatena]